jgi:hypothetical protein
MTDRGRHARRSGVGFYKDVLFLVAGILVVGAIVFGGLSLWAGRDNGGTPPDSSGTSATAAEQTTTSTTRPTTSQGRATSSTTTSTTAPTSTTESTAPPTTLRPARQPGEVSVIVLNSTATTGLAAELTDELAALGYLMSEPTNYTPELSDTMIFHADGFSLEALDLVDAVPDGTVAADAALAGAHGVDIVVVIGLSYQE